MNDRPTIVYLCPSSVVSGAENSLLSLLAAIDRTQFAPLLACPEDSPLRPRAAALGVDTLAVPALRLQRHRRLRSMLDLRAFSRALDKALSGHPCDLIHANSTTAALGGLYAARRLGVPLIWHVRDTVPLGLIRRVLARRVAAIVAISRTVAESIGPPRGGAAVQVIYNGIVDSDVPVRQRRPAIRRELNIAESAPLLITVSQLAAWKRVNMVLQIFAGVRRRLPKATLAVAGTSLSETGDGNAGHQGDCARHELEALAKELDVADAVRFVGYRNDVPDLVSAADLLVSAAHREPLGRAVLEAMALGTPVVVSREGGHLELIEEGHSGLAFDADNMDEAVEKCLAVLQNAGEAARLAEAARQRAVEEFSTARMTAAMHRLYASALRPGGT